MMISNTEPAVRKVVAEFAELASALEDHIHYFSELLPHLFFWDVTLWIEKKALEKSAMVNGFVNLVEHLYEEGELPAENLLIVSFLEDISPDSSLSTNPVILRLLARVREDFRIHSRQHF